MTKKDQKTGSMGEALADNRLRAIGLEMVEKIGTPVKLIPLSQFTVNLLRRCNSNPEGIFRVIFGEKVSGDRRAVVPGSGRSVLVETKTILDRNLRWSDLRDHQPGALSLHTELGGLSLLAWVHSSGVYIMRWPVAGFRHGKSIDPSTANELNIRSVFDEN